MTSRLVFFLTFSIWGSKSCYIQYVKYLYTLILYIYALTAKGLYLCSNTFFSCLFFPDKTLKAQKGELIDTTKWPNRQTNKQMHVSEEKLWSWVFLKWWFMTLMLIFMRSWHHNLERQPSTSSMKYLNCRVRKQIAIVSIFFLWKKWINGCIRCKHECFMVLSTGVIKHPSFPVISFPLTLSQLFISTLFSVFANSAHLTGQFSNLNVTTTSPRNLGTSTLHVIFNWFINTSHLHFLLNVLLW